MRLDAITAWWRARGGWSLSLFRGVWHDGVDFRIGEVSPQCRLAVHTVLGFFWLVKTPGGPGLCLKARRAGASSLTPRLSTTFNIV